MSEQQSLANVIRRFVFSTLLPNVSPTSRSHIYGTLQAWARVVDMLEERLRILGNAAEACAVAEIALKRDKEVITSLQERIAGLESQLEAAT